MKVSPRLIAPLVNGLYRFWCKTLRYTEVNRDLSTSYMQQGKLLVFTLWHDELFPLPYRRGDWSLFTVVSRSQDGEYLAGILKSVGLGTVRGSSSRGGLAALLQAVRLMKEQKQHACISVDGPRGPRHEVKDGAIFLAQHVPAYIVPVRMYASKVKKFASWDRFQLPWPFARVRMIYGDPYQVEADDLTPDALERDRQRLKEKLENLV